MANSRLTATQAENNYRLSILTLTQLLELPTPEGFTIQRPTQEELDALSQIGILGPDQIYAEALGVKPEILSQQLKMKGSEHSIKIAQAANYPTLSLGGGLGTNYYTTSGFTSDPFGTQLKNNFSQYVSLNLNIPIFHRFMLRKSSCTVGLIAILTRTKCMRLFCRKRRISKCVLTDWSNFFRT